MDHIIGGQIDYGESLDALPDDSELTKQERVDIALGKDKGAWSCTWAPNGLSVACGPRDPQGPDRLGYDDELTARQADAGEEDQSLDGSDEGA